MRREIEVASAEIVFHVDGRLNVANLEACVDVAGQFKFGNDFEDAVIQSISVDAAPVRRETSWKR